MTTAAMTTRALRACIAGLPRQRLAALPTACEELPRLAAHVGTATFLLKRDDLTGLGLGGNKSRAMDFVIGEARSRGCDVLVAGGGVEQSNHARQCVAAAIRSGMDAVVVLQRRHTGFRSNGNLLAAQLLGAQVVWIDSDPTLRDRHAAHRRMAEIATDLVAEGRRPYVLASSLHPLSVVAYVEAALELAEQIGPEPARIYATSEGAVLGGLLLGAHAMGLPWQVTGVDWRPAQPGTANRIAAVVAEAAALLRLDLTLAPETFRVLPGGGQPYGEGSAESWAALDLLARLEAVFLDPVYTARGMAGCLADLRASPDPHKRVVFVHTGGVPALFAYADEVARNVLSVRDTSAGAAGSS